MEPAKKSGKESFNRTAYFNYNAVTQQYEYFSLDSRAPQMMNERSEKAEEQSEHGNGGIKLYGGSFVAPKWGEATNVPFTYRLTVGEIENNSQVVQLYLTPQSGESPKEFSLSSMSIPACVDVRHRHWRGQRRRDIAPLFAGSPTAGKHQW